MKSLTIVGKRWFDKVNGNTYHSARAFADGKLIAVAPFQYGYGNQWEWSIAGAIEKAGFMPDRKDKPLWQYFRDDRGIELLTLCTDGLKRDCIAWGEIESL